MTITKKRTDLIRKIERARGSKVIAYVLGDRQPLGTQIDDSQMRLMYEHLLALKKNPERIDLFLYSRGGSVEVPWKLVSMIREFTDHFSVLIPYRAHSAATMISIGADEIIMGRKGELGPIDPIMNRQIRVGDNLQQSSIPIEDILSFVDFVKVRAGITDQKALSDTIKELPHQLEPWVIGSVYRIHEHIMLVAKKLIESTEEKISESKVKQIVETLVEKTYLHGHAIGRKEARELGLPVVFPQNSLEKSMWDLLVEYEKQFSLLDIIEEDDLLEKGDEARKSVELACIESTSLLHFYGGDLLARKVRTASPVTLNLNLHFPPGIDINQIPLETQQLLQKLLDQTQREALSQVRTQLPIERIEKKLVGCKWTMVEPKNYQ